MTTENLLGYGVVHERCVNRWFDHWTGNLPDNWTVLYGSTQRESSIVYVSTYSCRLASEIDYDGNVYQDIVSYEEWIGRNATFTARVWCNTPNVARIGLSDGLTTVWSSFHPGTGAWVQLSVTRFISSGATATRPVLTIVRAPGNPVAFFDDCSVPLFVPGDPNAYADLNLLTDFIIDDETRTAGVEDRPLIIDVGIEFYEPVASKLLDLMKLVPIKFRDSVILQQYLEEVSVGVSQWLTAINQLANLIDPYTVPEEYIQKLADLISLVLSRGEGITIEDLRAQLRQTIDWYRIKGTYESIELVAYLSKLTTEVFDYYTNDYVAFVPQPWFVGDEGENPPGLNNTYYKSPHFGVEITLDRVYDTGSGEYLFKEFQITPMIDKIEATRPVNTVPHYIIKLIAVTYEDGVLYTTPGNFAKTLVTDNWTFQRMYFDGGGVRYVVDSLGNQVVDSLGNPIVVHGLSWNFDDGVFFDQDYTTFLSSINHWKIGTGNKGIPPTRSGWSLQTPVTSGTVNAIRILDDRTEYDLVVPAAFAQTGISELGLYLPDQTTLVVASTFADIDKPAGVDLRILVQIYK